MTMAALKSTQRPPNPNFTKFGGGFQGQGKGQGSSTSTKAKQGATIGGKVVKKSQKQKVTEDMVKNEICVSWNSGRCAIAPPKKVLVQTCLHQPCVWR